jgi:predicted RNA-binding protein YlqC (UPF0109 family)
MNAQALIEHILKPIVQYPESLEFNIIEGSAVIVVELRVHDDDLTILTNNDSEMMHSIQQLLTVSAKELKPSLELLNLAS